MSRLEHRIRALEQKRSGPKPVVFVFPRATSPEHLFRDDEANYQDLAENTYGRKDFNLAVWPGDDKRTEPKLMFVENVAKFFANIAKNSTRAGVKPNGPETGGE